VNEFEGTLVVTLRLPIKLHAAHRDDATVRHARALLSVPDPTGQVPAVRLAGRSEPTTPAARAGRRHGRAPTRAAEPPVAAAALTLF
jgi:hypothetical protein